MHRRPRPDPDDDDDDDLPDGVYHDDDEPATVPCPYCKRPILEDADRCPYCENYISAEDQPSQPKSWGWIIGMVLALLVALIWAFAL